MIFISYSICALMKTTETLQKEKSKSGLDSSQTY